MPDHPVSDLTAWEERRFARMESDLSSLVTKLDKLLEALPDRYVPRREFDDLTRRMNKAEENQSKAMWLVLGTLAATLGNIAVLALKSMTGHV